MAENSVDDVDVSEILTNFFHTTCRRLQPSAHLVVATEVCAKMATRHFRVDDDEADIIPLTTGSVAEFYIEPMWPCVGDIDTMVQFSTQLAIPAGYPAPSQLPAEFHSRIKVREIIDSEYPGYVYLVLCYLLTENADGDKYMYNAVRCARRQYLPHHSWLRTNMHFEAHGPAMRTRATYAGTTPCELISCVRCLYWPTQAADWPMRHRNYGWPDLATVDRVVSNGCDVVGVAHRQCKQNNWTRRHQWRLSFSRAEIVLLNSWMPVQQIVYHMLRQFLKFERMTDITTNTGTKVLSNYHIKTLMLWASELKPRNWWIDDTNLVRICVVILHTATDWLNSRDCPHYFVKNCNLIDTSLHTEIIGSQSAVITESWLSAWFVNGYLRVCAKICPDKISRSFADFSTRVKLQDAVSAVVDWRVNTALEHLWQMIHTTEFHISNILYCHPLSLRLYEYSINPFSKIDSCLHVYVSAIIFLHIAHKTVTYGLSDELADILTTTCGHFIGKKRYCHKLNSVQSLRQAAILMKVVANNSRSTVQLIEIELSKAYLHRALRCKDSDSNSICCLANVYLAVVYYTTGHYQTAIDHCTLRSQDHSQCSSHVVQGELLPKIDDDIDNVLGLAVFYQYVRTTALNQQQTQHVGVFTTEFFAHYLHIRCLSVMTHRYSIKEVEKSYMLSLFHRKQPHISDVLSFKLLQVQAQRNPLTNYCQIPALKSAKLDASELVELLQQSALEHLTTYRQLQAHKFSSVATIVTTDFEALYAYKRGNYRQCLQLSTQNARSLLYAAHMPTVPTFPEFIHLLDDDIVSLTALTLIVKPKSRKDNKSCNITQLTLSLYLMTQCQLKLHHSVTALAQTLDYIEVAQKTYPVRGRLDQLTLKLTERKALTYSASTIAQQNVDEFLRKLCDRRSNKE